MDVMSRHDMSMARWGIVDMCICILYFVLSRHVIVMSYHVHVHVHAHLDPDSFVRLVNELREHALPQPMLTRASMSRTSVASVVTAPRIYGDPATEPIMMSAVTWNQV